MANGIRRHLSFANVASLSALVFAMGGTSYALTIPKNSIGSAQIKKGAVANSDIRAKAVTGATVKNGSLLAADFAANQLPKASAGTPGPPGATGATGPQGATGATGATGTTGPAAARFETASVDLGNNAKASYDVYCPAGQQAIGGDGRGDDTASQLTSVTSSRPAVSTTNTEPPADGLGFTGWRITVSNLGANPGIRPTVWVICVAAPS